MTTTPTQADLPQSFVDVVFDGPPSAQSGRFVECEDPAGCSYLAGQWIDRGNGLWALRISLAASEARDVEEEPIALKIALDALWAYQSNWDTGLSGSYAQSERIAMECACEAVRDALNEALATRASEAAPHVGESRFEGWYADYLLSAPVHQELKQRARDAYAAGMGEAAPVVVGDTQPVAWRHNLTHCLYETEEEVPLADGDEWAVPLYLASQAAHSAPDVVMTEGKLMERVDHIDGQGYVHWKKNGQE